MTEGKPEALGLIVLWGRIDMICRGAEEPSQRAVLSGRALRERSYIRDTS